MVRKPEGRPIGRPRRRWEKNMRVDFVGSDYVGTDWILLAQYTDEWPALVNTLMNLPIP
jgi:hypothetical protein